MAHIERKEIPPGSGRYYLYLYQSYWKDGRVKKKYIKYLGPAGMLPKINTEIEERIKRRESISKHKHKTAKKKNRSY